MTYTNPMSGKEYSSSDEVFEGDDGFERFVFGNADAKDRDDYSGFLGAFGAKHLHYGEGTMFGENYPINVNGKPITHPVEDLNCTAPGDVGVSDVHTYPVAQVNDSTSKSVAYSSTYASGGYYGPDDERNEEMYGFGNSIMVPIDSGGDIEIEKDRGAFQVMRYSFLDGVPEKRQPLEKMPMSKIEKLPVDLDLPELQMPDPVTPP